jgi:hypothetical protein
MQEKSPEKCVTGFRGFGILEIGYDLPSDLSLWYVTFRGAIMQQP